MLELAGVTGIDWHHTAIPAGQRVDTIYNLISLYQWYWQNEDENYEMTEGWRLKNKPARECFPRPVTRSVFHSQNKYTEEGSLYSPHHQKYMFKRTIALELHVQKTVTTYTCSSRTIEHPSSSSGRYVSDEHFLSRSKPIKISCSGSS